MYFILTAMTTVISEIFIVSYNYIITYNYFL